MEQLNNVDVIILVVVALSMLVAFVRGFVKEVLSILGLALFVALTVALSPVLTAWMMKYIASKLMAQFVTLLLIMAVFYAFWIIGTDKLISRIRTSTLSFMDRLFGLIFGFLRAVLILGFVFLVVKIILPEELKEGPLKDSKYFMMAGACSDMIEKLLPDDFIKNTVKSVEDINKADTKNNAKDKAKSGDKKKPDTKKQESTGGLPTQLDQKQMDKMFELLVKPEVKNKENAVEKKPEKKKETKGYDNKEINSLDRLIDITAGSKE